MQTTIMAASYPGGVVLGADTRTSTGSYVANRLVLPVRWCCCANGNNLTSLTGWCRLSRVTNKLTQLAEKVRDLHAHTPSAQCRVFTPLSYTQFASAHSHHSSSISQPLLLGTCCHYAAYKLRKE